MPGTVAALLVAVSACSSSSPRPPDGDLIAAARQDEWAGGMVSNGDAEASCGEYVLAVGQPLPDEVADCLRAGATPDASVPAEAAWVSMTSEGDPLVTFAFTGSYVQGLSLSTFTGWDRHGGGGWEWTMLSCADPGDVHATGVCEQLVEG